MMRKFNEEDYKVLVALLIAGSLLSGFFYCLPETLNPPPACERLCCNEPPGSLWHPDAYAVHTCPVDTVVVYGTSIGKVFIPDHDRVVIHDSFCFNGDTLQNPCEFTIGCFANDSTYINCPHKAGE